MKKIENIFLLNAETDHDNYVGKQTSSNRVGNCTHLHFILHKKNTGSKRPVLCQCVCFFTHADEG